MTIDLGQFIRDYRATVPGATTMQIASAYAERVVQDGSDAEFDTIIKNALPEIQNYTGIDDQTTIEG